MNLSDGHKEQCFWQETHVSTKVAQGVVKGTSRAFIGIAFV